MKVNYFYNVYDIEPKEAELEDVLGVISEGTLKPQVERIRSVDRKDKARRKKIKKQLPMFRPAIRMNHRTNMDDEYVVTGIVHFDLDLDDNYDYVHSQDICSSTAILAAIT